MKVLNIGSMNLDHVYSVDHIVQPGETEDVTGIELFLGGKGMNQSVSLAKAGVEVYHCGMIGEDGRVFVETSEKYGVNSTFIKEIKEKTGHTIIQIDKNAQNSILLYGGANQCLTKGYIDSVISNFGEGDILLLQNEVNMLPYIVDTAYEKGMIVALNPSPFNEKLADVDMNKISIFLVNEIEGGQITGREVPDEIISEMKRRFPEARIVLTLGKDGVIYADEESRYFQPAFEVEAVDTTAAGDTFTGYFLAGLAENMPIPDILKMSSKASSIAVSRKGAVPSIPYRDEVMEALRKN